MDTKETKAEKFHSLSLDSIKAFQEDSKNWNERLVSVITDYAQLPGFNIVEPHKTEWQPDINEPHFCLTPDPDVLGYDTILRIRIVPLSCDDFAAIDEAEKVVRMYHEQMMESERQFKVRMDALAKLNHEEKQLLGLTK
jgi:hypothetical protein